MNPELVYVVSSHYDSVAVGPGADDDTSGTAALLETARVLADHPMPATIVFASFTGEESGLLGSREFVRRAVESKMKIVGALNNDMIGWANDARLDNTIRYSNPGIRDIQHGAAILFSRLITYDALYYKGTDAASYYDAYGDIVGGIGSYPVLGNPHYHQPNDLLEYDQPPADRGDEQDDGGDADAAGVEPVADQECEGSACRGGRHRDVDAESRSRHCILRRRVRSAVESAASPRYRDDAACRRSQGSNPGRRSR